MMSRRIHEVRRNLGLTQPEFGQALGTSLRAVQTWEAGVRTPRARTLRRIAVMAEKPVAWFYEEEAAA